MHPVLDHRLISERYFFPRSAFSTSAARASVLSTDHEGQVPACTSNVSSFAS